MRTIALEEHFRSSAFRKAQASGTIGVQESPILEAAVGRLYDVGEERLASMKASGIDVQVLSHAPPGPQELEPPAAVALAREMNDELGALVRAQPSSYAGFAMLPTNDPDAAADELHRAVRELDLRGAMIHGTTCGRFLDHPSFSPILEAAEQLGVPIYLHPAPPPAAIRDPYYSGFAPEVSGALATSAWGWHIETGLHVLRLILAGAFDRYPRLQVIIGHMGETIPFMLARTDRVLGQFTKLERRPRDYFLQNVHYTTSGFFTPEPLRCLLDVIGADRLMFAVDYPFSSNDVAGNFLRAARLTPDDREKIAHGNSEALLRL